MKKLSYLIVLILILGLVLTGCLLSNVGQVPTTDQSGIAYLTKTVDPPLDLVALWHFDEGSEATTVADSSGNDNTGDIYDATPGEVGQFGNALSFDGNDYVRVPGSTSLSGINSVITVETWLKFSSVTNAFYVRTPFDNEFSWAWGLDRLGGNLRFYIYNNNNYFICQKGWTPVVDQWYHIAGTYNGQTLKLYVDKELFKSFEHVGAIDSTDQGVVIGAKYSDGSEGNLHGLIDEVRIWNGALTADQLGDITPPIINIITPADNAIYLLNQVENANWSAIDTGTGVASESGTCPSGDPINTSTVGEKTFEVTAIDYAKNEANKTVTYYVNYVFNGFLPPVSLDKPFKWGRTIPIKFQLTDAQGAFITNALPSISWELLSNGTPTGDAIDGDSSGAANTDNIFRYDSNSNQYIFNLATKGMDAPATYRITVELGDGTTQLVDIGLK